MSTSAHDLLRVRDCLAPNCANEAVAGDHLCNEHVAGRVKDAADKQEKRDRARAARAANPGVCKVDGCDDVANTKYSRGTFARLCDTHIETAREESRQRSREAWARRHGITTPLTYQREPKPEPEPAVEAPPMLQRIPTALEHAARAAHHDLSPAIRVALADLLDAISKELRAA